MWQQEFLWFFTIFITIFAKQCDRLRGTNGLAVAHCSGSITPNNWLTFSKFLINSSLRR